MRFFKKFAGLFAAALLLVPSLGQAYTINGNLDVRGNVVGGVRRIGDTNNLTLSLASGILKIQCGNADCSTSNPGWVTLPSNTAGQMVTYKITSSPQFGDATAGDSDFVGTGTCSWGTTASVAWGDAMPILLGAFHDGTTVVFGMARGPVFTTGASTNIGYQDNCPSSADQKNIIAMTSSNVTSSHANKAFFPIGAVRATKNASDNYTFSALDDGDGIQIFYNFGNRDFDMPTGQNGATSGKYGKDNGGTFPTFTADNFYKYKPQMNGDVRISTKLSNTSGGTTGAVAVTTLVPAPYAFKGSANQRSKGDGFAQGTSLQTYVTSEINGASNDIYFSYVATAPSGTTALQNSQLNTATRNLHFDITFSAY